MKKHIFIAATAAALFFPGLSSNAFAASHERSSEQQQLSEEHMAAFTEARIAALKAGLKLTTAQDKNWPNLEATLREVAKDRAARSLEWRQKSPDRHDRDDVIEGLRLRANGLSTRSSELEKIADAAKPLYDSLGESQKLRFGVLLHDVFTHHDHHWRWGYQSDESDDAQRQD